jgi:hypothetical protein
MQPPKQVSPQPPQLLVQVFPQSSARTGWGAAMARPNTAKAGMTLPPALRKPRRSILWEGCLVSSDSGYFFIWPSKFLPWGVPPPTMFHAPTPSREENTRALDRIICSCLNRWSCSFLSRCLRSDPRIGRDRNCYIHSRIDLCIRPDNPPSKCQRRFLRIRSGSRPSKYNCSRSRSRPCSYPCIRPCSCRDKWRAPAGELT